MKVPRELIAKRIALTFITIWGLFFFPVLIFIILALETYASSGLAQSTVGMILYYNLLAFPWILIVSTGGGLLLVKYKHYYTAVFFAILPLLNMLLEVIVADIILLIQ